MFSLHSYVNVFLNLYFNYVLLILVFKLMFLCVFLQNLKVFPDHNAVLHVFSTDRSVSLTGKNKEREFLMRFPESKIAKNRQKHRNGGRGTEVFEGLTSLDLFMYH